MRNITRPASRIACALWLFALAALAAAPCRADPIVLSNFDADADGWTVVNDNSTAVTWFATGGNPGGHIRNTDGLGGATWFFVAPAKFLGNQSAAYGGTLTFDQSQSPFTAAGGQDVVLVGTNGLTLFFDNAQNAAGYPVWTSYQIALDDTAPWRVSGSGALATRAQIQSVLASLAALRIRGEYSTTTDTGYLDNVALNASPIPEPAAVALLGSGLAGSAAAIRRRRRPAAAAGGANDADGAGRGDDGAPARDDARQSPADTSRRPRWQDGPRWRGVSWWRRAGRTLRRGN